MATSSAPLEIGRVVLKVRDLDTVGGFYEQALGLAPINRNGESATYGTGDRVLLELHGDTAAPRGSPREAGLFHTAFLLPSRADLGAWLHHAAETRVPLQGASDHLVSEALYLADPEGNGIEIYVDRPRDQWTVKDGQIAMATEPLDLNDVASSATAPWSGVPDGTVVGHVHLQVGALDPSEEFIKQSLGMDLTTRYPGANFFSSGGYHHHLAGNIWNSRNAGTRTPEATGLTEVEILGTPAGLANAALQPGAVLTDPWGTRFHITQKEA
ncbi:VOC family protein [Pseudoruegeria sp. HB172150]|uniref:VOC family protein n=1 Tax=Pseudoruegeria sp. HB172150 TaxID=2721164 RepID=UPI00155647CF|nr:VOC family protein [Pseudoruegeria sp. HB172150]